MIAQVELTEGMEVLCLMGTRVVGSKKMIEAILEAVLVTPTPPLALGRPGIAMQTAIDI
jgi:hypothetical protein